MKLMTRDEFIAYAHGLLDPEGMECLYDTIAQHNSEVAAFGDSWPGALVKINEDVQLCNNVERQLARLEQRQPRDFHFSVRWPR